MKWGGYPRISEDPKDLRAGIDRQIEDITAAIVARGGSAEDIRWFVENDTSAYKKKRVSLTDPLGNAYYGYRVIRPVWHQALHELRSGAIDGLMVWDLDRLARDNRDLEDAIEVVQYYGRRIEGTKAGSIDLTSDGGMAMARVIVAFNNKSSADTGRRVKRAHRAAAKAGRPVGGYRPFGWKADRSTLDPKESRLVREAVEELIAGGTIRGIVRRWTEAGIKTTANADWKGATLRQYLRNARLVGYRTYNREVLLDDYGKPVRGLWEPMLDLDQWERLQAVLAKPEGRTRVPRRDARHYLLTGILRCGRCSAVMYGNRYPTGKHYYSCKDNGHVVTASGEGCDRLMGKLVLARMADEALETQPVQWDGEQALAAVQGKIDALMDAFLAGTLTGDVAFPRVQALEAELAEMREGRALWLASTTGPAIQQVTPEQWESWDDDERRPYVEKVIDAVFVRPATQRGNRFDPERLDVVWKRPGGRPSLVAVPS